MISKIAVLGAGQMGLGIAQTGAQAGFQILLADVSLEHATRGKDKIAAGLAKLCEKGRLDASGREAILAAITPVGGVTDFGSADLLIEAVSENPELKFRIFRSWTAWQSPRQFLRPTLPPSVSPRLRRKPRALPKWWECIS